jgi:phosphatidylglycerol:prolipoprotein diacylglycerol transferase
MYPTLVRLPALGLTVSSYHTLILLAAIVCFVIGPRWAERLEGIDRRIMQRAFLVVAVATFAGGRLHFIINQWALFAGRPLDALKIWSAGLHASGAIAGLVLSAIWAAHHWRLPLGQFADGMAPTIGIGIAIARIGCFLQGCCFGLTCTWPWCMRFPRDTYIYEYHQSLGLLQPGAGATAPVHPLQLYFSAAGLALTAVALWTRRRKRYHGEAALAALLTYSVSAAALEFFRADNYPRAYWGPLPQLEWMALGMLVATAAALIATNRNFSPRRHGDTETNTQS